jgi:hypothetical protein
MTPAWKACGSDYSGNVPYNYSRTWHIESICFGHPHNCLGILKVSSCWVPRMLTQVQMQYRVKFSEENFGLHEADPETFLSKIITSNEMWIHRMILKNVPWKHRCSFTPTKFWMPLAGKIVSRAF